MTNEHKASNASASNASASNASASNASASKRKDKDAFRKTKEWKSFRAEMKEESNGKDALTNKPLRAGWNLHHLNLNPVHYADISDASHFVCLNRQSHEFVHWLYRYYEKDTDIIDRIVGLMNRMKSLNGQCKQGGHNA